MADISTEQSYGIMTEIPGVARNYKDRVFRMVFKEKKALLALYNAMNGTVYEDEDALTVTTLVHRFRNNYTTHLSKKRVFKPEKKWYCYSSTERFRENISEYRRQKA